VIAVLDVDGTLVDTNYRHARCWQDAFADHGLTVPAWRIHRHIGMGGDQLVPAVAGEEFESEHGEAVRATESDLYMDQIDEVTLLPGARELIDALAGRDMPVVLASSARDEEIDHYLRLIDRGDAITAHTSAGDVDRTKPAPDLLEVAVRKGGGGHATLVGDSVWDVEAAAGAGVATIGLLSGGFGEAELRDAGAEAVFDDAADLAGRLDETRLG